jgi:YVTN family beta-propeller protein
MRTVAVLLAVVAALPGMARADTLIIGNKAEDTVSFLDLATAREFARVPTGKAPHEVAVSPDGTKAAVVAYGGASIDVFDVATKRLRRRIDLGNNGAPHGLVWLRNGRLVATTEKSRSIVIADPGSGRFKSVRTDQDGSHMVAASPGGRRAYVANIRSGTVSVIDLRKARKLADIGIGGMPEAIALGADGERLWVGDLAKAHVRVVDTKTHRTVATLPTDSVAIRVAISPDGRKAVTSNVGTGTLSVFDTATLRLLRTIRVSGERAAFQVTILFSPDSRRIYVAETARNTIAEVDVETGEVLRRLAGGSGSDGLAIVPSAARRLGRDQ